MRLPLSLMAALILSALPARASERVVVVELFSSQACPSCPAADAVVSSMAQADATLLPLDRKRCAMALEAGRHSSSSSSGGYCGGALPMALSSFG